MLSLCPLTVAHRTKAQKLTMEHTILTHPDMIAAFFDYCHQNDEFSVYITVPDTELEEDNVAVVLSELEEYYDEKGFWITESTRARSRRGGWCDGYDACDASADNLAEYLKRNRSQVLKDLTNIIRWRGETEAREAARAAA